MVLRMPHSEGQKTEGNQIVKDLTGITVGRFAVRARLGAGGMGEVYRAEDTKLKRPVALKRMAPHLRTDAQYRQRFLKEAERASGLSDPHIAAVHDILEEKGETFLVMEYVEGATLRQQLKEKISVEAFLPVAVQCAEALAAAHEKGIIHRDIKPENIMLTPTGHVKVLDFGVAKRLPVFQENAATASLPTPSGTLGGTPAYMAPEVLLEKETDGRADIFSLGVVFYESLAGRHPFSADSFVSTSDRILHEEPTPLRKFNPSVPKELAHIAAKMLAKNPVERYATARDLLADLRACSLPRRGRARTLLRARWRTAGAIGVLVVLLLFAVLGPVRRQLRDWLGGIGVPPEKNLAVLPFAAVGGDPKTAAFGDGLTETLTAKLTQLTDRYPLQVVPASEMRAHHLTSVGQAHQELGVNLVLEGSLHRAGKLVRVNFTLVDAKTRRQIRAETITAAASDPFAVEDQVVEGVIRMLDLAVKPKERRALTTHGTQVASAFDLYLQGRGYLQNYDKPENIESAITLFQQALRLDANFAQASAGLGEAYWKEYEAKRELSLVEMARQACDRAETLDAKLAEAHICLGTLHNGTGQYYRAVAEFQRALELEPTRDDAYRGLAAANEGLARLGESEKAYRRAITLRPQYWAGYSWLGTFYYHQARYEEAARMFAKVVELAPDNFVGCRNLGGIYVLQGRYAEAIPMFERSVALRPTARAYSNLATAYFNLHRFAEAARTFDEAVKLDGQDYVMWGNLGDACSWVPGRRAQAVSSYQKAISLAKEQLQINPRDAALLGNLASYYAMLKEKEPALACLGRALALAPGDPQLRYMAALVYNQSGESDRALGWLEKALAAGFSSSTIRDNPFFDNLRGKPRFQELVQGQGSKEHR